MVGFGESTSLLGCFLISGLFSYMSGSDHIFGPFLSPLSRAGPTLCLQKRNDLIYSIVDGGRFLYEFHLEPSLFIMQTVQEVLQKILSPGLGFLSYSRFNSAAYSSADSPGF